MALAPAATYRVLLAEERPRGSWRILVRPATVLLVIGTAVSIMLTRRPTLAVIVLSAVFWSFVVAVQFLAGAAVIASSPARRVGLLRGLDLWFAGHLHSLWLLGVAALVEVSGRSPLLTFLLSALIPAAWTVVIGAAFCRTVLATEAAGARWRMALHQMAILGVATTYVLWSAGGYASVASFLARQVGQR